MKNAAWIIASIALVNVAWGATRDREPGVPVRQAQPDTTHLTLLTPPGGENQKLYGTRRPALINEEAAKDVTARFREAYAKDGALRIVVFVNRAIEEERGGLRLTGRTERFNETTTEKDGEPGTTTSDVSGENTYETAEMDEAPTIADRQTEREIERLFGRVFRHGGAVLADARAASVLRESGGEGRRVAQLAGRERAALKEVADVAIEVWVSSRPLTVRTVSGDVTLEAPDLQVTAVRLSDAAIVGQAAASDLLGAGVRAAQIVRQFGVAEITEATAFALMEDMLTGEAE
jgi:hypothetical protein